MEDVHRSVTLPSLLLKRRDLNRLAAGRDGCEWTWETYPGLTKLPSYAIVVQNGTL